MLKYDNQSEWSNDFGSRQSPVLINTQNELFTDSGFNYTVNSQYLLTTSINDQTTIRLTGNGHATIFNREFSFQQVHFHAPAEHVIDGQQVPFEIHLVHQNQIGQTLVTALMVKVGADNDQLEQIIDTFDPNQDKKVQIDVTDWINFDNKHGFHYLGSLTTPPLTEGVEWLIINNAPITIGKEQLVRYQQLFSPNNRDLQPLNDRRICRF
ncbi:carbonic anhydrase family protein [Lactobacillus sp. Sy-1]|uniref:carbonic anhydrase family protein n=1 Tax=Lactobacillus sp. Sy-1 TaxID=2109645 RepID=UPI001C5BF291|nr:carbonic anhydrase family protein [Lactobacillus sp. Sy-1]MBW1606035.1 carbonic anhydrase family protein [Lactobacillus sp. Sy-1]